MMSLFKTLSAVALAPLVMEPALAWKGTRVSDNLLGLYTFEGGQLLEESKEGKFAEHRRVQCRGGPCPFGDMVLDEQFTASKQTVYWNDVNTGLRVRYVVNNMPDAPLPQRIWFETAPGIETDLSFIDMDEITVEMWIQYQPSTTAFGSYMLFTEPGFESDVTQATAEDCGPVDTVGAYNWHLYQKGRSLNTKFWETDGGFCGSAGTVSRVDSGPSASNSTRLEDQEIMRIQWQLEYHSGSDKYQAALGALPELTGGGEYQDYAYGPKSPVHPAGSMLRLGQRFTVTDNPMDFTVLLVAMYNTSLDPGLPGADSFGELEYPGVCTDAPNMCQNWQAWLPNSQPWCPNSRKVVFEDTCTAIPLTSDCVDFDTFYAGKPGFDHAPDTDLDIYIGELPDKGTLYSDSGCTTAIATPTAAGVHIPSGTIYYQAPPNEPRGGNVTTYTTFDFFAKDNVVEPQEGTRVPNDRGPPATIIVDLKAVDDIPTARDVTASDPVGPVYQGQCVRFALYGADEDTDTPPNGGDTNFVERDREFYAAGGIYHINVPGGDDSIWVDELCTTPYDTSVPRVGGTLGKTYFYFSSSRPIVAGQDILGTSIFSWTAEDSTGNVSPAASITIEVRNPLDATGETQLTCEDTRTTIYLSGGDNRPGNNTVYGTLVTAPSAGSIYLVGSDVPLTDGATNLPTTLEYDPPANAIGENFAFFEYTLTADLDGLETNPTTSYITMDEANDAPVPALVGTVPTVQARQTTENYNIAFTFSDIDDPSNTSMVYVSVRSENGVINFRKRTSYTLAELEVCDGSWVGTYLDSGGGDRTQKFLRGQYHDYIEFACPRYIALEALGQVQIRVFDDFFGIDNIEVNIYDLDPLDDTTYGPCDDPGTIYVGTLTVPVNVLAEATLGNDASPSLFLSFTWQSCVLWGTMMLGCCMCCGYKGRRWYKKRTQAMADIDLTASGEDRL